MSDAVAAIWAAVIAGSLGLAGVWLGFYLGRRASREDQSIEKLFTIYRETERLWNLLLARQKQLIDQAKFYRLWNETTENIMQAVLGSTLKRADKNRILKAINTKWDDATGTATIKSLADDLLETIDPEYARAAKEMLQESGVKPEDIDPIILHR